MIDVRTNCNVAFASSWGTKPCQLGSFFKAYCGYSGYGEYYSSGRDCREYSAGHAYVDRAYFGESQKYFTTCSDRYFLYRCDFWDYDSAVDYPEPYLGMSALREKKGRVLLYVQVSPNASKEEISGLDMDAYGQLYLKTRVRAVADKGKANNALLAFLAKKMEISKSLLSISAGEKQKRKVIHIACSPKVARSHFNAMIENI